MNQREYEDGVGYTGIVLFILAAVVIWVMVMFAMRWVL